MSSIRINYLSYRVVPLVQNGNTHALGNSPYRVEPISAVNTNIGYNPNRPKIEVYSANNKNKNNSSFEDVLQEEMAKSNGLGRKR